MRIIDPSKVLHLGKDANVRVVKDTDLSRFRIIAFSTHALLPGDLDGLTQPALAPTAPSVAEVDGDGLLTMEDILRLKLDADWALLSACNTAAGTGSGRKQLRGLAAPCSTPAAVHSWCPTGPGIRLLRGI